MSFQVRKKISKKFFIIKKIFFSDISTLIRKSKIANGKKRHKIIRKWNLFEIIFKVRSRILSTWSSLQTQAPTAGDVHRVFERILSRRSPLSTCTVSFSSFFQFFEVFSSSFQFYFLNFFEFKLIYFNFSPSFDIPQPESGFGFISKKTSALIVCHNCGELGHKMSQCTRVAKEEIMKQAVSHRNFFLNNILNFMRPTHNLKFWR